MANDNKKYLDQTGLEKVWGLTKVLVDNKIDDFKDGLATTAVGNGSYIDVEITQAEGKVANVKIDDDKINNAIISGSTLKNDIKILGGPLSDDVSSNWPTDWKNAAGEKVIPKGKTFEEILTGLFFIVKSGNVSWGSKSWNYSKTNPSVSLSSSTAEIGSNVTIKSLSTGTVSPGTRSCSLSFDSTYGYFLSDKKTWRNSSYTVSKTGSTYGTASLSYYWNNTPVSKPTLNSTTFKVGSGTNTFKVTQTGIYATVDALPTTIVYASTNTKEIDESKSATLTDTKPADKTWSASEWYGTATVTGSYKYFYGSVAKTTATGLNITAESIKTLSNTGWANTISSEKTILENVRIDKNGNTYIVAVPEEYTISSVLQSGQNVAVSWKNESGGPKQTVAYKLPDNNTKTYNIFYCENDSDFNADLTKLTIKRI